MGFVCTKCVADKQPNQVGLPVLEVLEVVLEVVLVMARLRAVVPLPGLLLLLLSQLLLSIPLLDSRQRPSN